jgi:flagellar hook protein FlgE
MMNQAFYTGINGLQTHQYSIDVITHNIANINTPGFRGSQVEFSSFFEKSLNTDSLGSSTANSIGIGAQIQATPMMQSNGALIDTDLTTNLALEGDGWFGISAPDGNFYTRAGDFSFDGERNLVTTAGHFVLGTMGSNINNGVLTEELVETPLGTVGTQVSLRMPQDLIYPVQPTTEAQFFGNLGVDNVGRLNSASIIDANGQKNRLELRFNMSNPQPTTGTAWDIVATVTNADGSVLYDTQTGSATFDEFGAITGFTMPSVNNNGTTVSIDLGTGFGGMIANAGDSAGEFSSASNGFEGGELVGYDINKNADIIATFTNGRQSAIGKVAVYHFQNDQGLERISGTLFKESSNSGQPIFYTDADGNAILGAITRNAMLENSNVRTEVSMTELIVMQRSYDANSKSVTTADELIQKALQMDA